MNQSRLTGTVLTDKCNMAAWRYIQVDILQHESISAIKGERQILNGDTDWTKVYILGIPLTSDLWWNPIRLYILEKSIDLIQSV